MYNNLEVMIVPESTTDQRIILKSDAGNDLSFTKPERKNAVRSKTC